MSMSIYLLSWPYLWEKRKAWLLTDGLVRDVSDDSEAESGFKYENNDTNASDDFESPTKKIKTNSKIKVENAGEEIGVFQDSGYENGSGGDGPAEMEEGIYA